jgi:hypothetical protein
MLMIWGVIIITAAAYVTASAGEEKGKGSSRTTGGDGEVD